MDDDIYRERARLVSFITNIYPSHIRTDEKEPDWPIVCVHTSEGQLTWHITKKDMDLFDHLKVDEKCVWDGHTTEEKYERLLRLGIKWSTMPSEVTEAICVLL